MAAPWERFRLADTVAVEPVMTKTVEDPEAAMPIAATRKVDRKGTISFASVRYKAGAWLAGETVEVVCDGGLVQLHHRGVVIATHARRHDLAKQIAGLRRRARGSAPAPRRPTASAVSVTRKVDSSGNVSFAGSHYRAGNAYRRRRIQVAVVGDHVEIVDRRRAHPSPPDPSRPHPRTRRTRQPRRPTSPHQRCVTQPELSGSYRSQSVKRSKLTTASLDRYYRSLLVDGGRNGRPLAPGRSGASTGSCVGRSPKVCGGAGSA
jgi:hypothetical protein